MQDLVSIIVPAYNVENFISGCLQSVLNQSYKELELIIVDDGSNDRTLEVVKEFIRESKDERIRLLVQDNRGVSIARNTALEVAAGEYVVFLDSDDCICSNYIELLMNVAIKTEADIVMCRPRMVKSVEERNKWAELPYNETYDRVFYSSDQALRLLLSQRIPGSSCEKVFRKRCIQKLRFPEGIRNNEDKMFLYEAIKNANCICGLSARLYICLERIDSATRNTSVFNIDSVLVAERIFDDTRNMPCDKDLTSLAEYHYFSIVIYNLRVLMRRNMVRENRVLFFGELRSRIEKMRCARVLMQHSNMYAIEWMFIMLGYNAYRSFVRVCDLILRN